MSLFHSFIHSSIHSFSPIFTKQYFRGHQLHTWHYFCNACKWMRQSFSPHRTYFRRSEGREAWVRLFIQQLLPNLVCWLCPSIYIYCPFGPRFSLGLVVGWLKKESTEQDKTQSLAPCVIAQKWHCESHYSICCTLSKNKMAWIWTFLVGMIKGWWDHKEIMLDSW